MKKKTLVLGASENPERYAHIAVLHLMQEGIEVAAVGHKEGNIQGVKILTGFPPIKDVDTVTMYVGPRNQPAFYDYILSLHPRRVIFNPGAENPEFEEVLRKNGIEPVEACTLVMLSIGNY